MSHIEFACCGLGQFEKAEEYGMLSLAQEEEYFRCWGLALLGVVRKGQGDFLEDETLLREAIESIKYSENQYGEAHCWHMLGEVHLAAGRGDLANQAFKASLSLYQTLKLNYKIEELTAQYKIAD